MVPQKMNSVARMCANGKPLRLLHAALLSLALMSGATASPVSAKTPKDQQAFLAACKDWDDTDKPAPPFKVYGNTYYVGTCGISAILVTGSKGHILIDSGTENGARVVIDNIRKLGFDVRDIKYLLHSNEQFEHVGGMAVLRAASGAWVIPSEHAEQVLKTGIADQSDPQASELPKMAPVEVYQTISDGNWIELGKLVLNAIATPGQTQGALTWQWNSCEKSKCISIVYADTLSPVGSGNYRFADHPERLAKYRESVDRVADLHCDLLLTPNPSASNMLNRMAAGSLEGIDQCLDYADVISKRIDERLANEAMG